MPAVRADAKSCPCQPENEWMNNPTDILIAMRLQKSLNRKSKKTVTKFKIRCSRYLYTLVVDDSDKADKIRQSLPPSMGSAAYGSRF